jgi:hypothetical protein
MTTAEKAATESYPRPLGATWDGKGVNFSLFSTPATRVEIGLFTHMLGEAAAITFPLCDFGRKPTQKEQVGGLGVACSLGCTAGV